MDSFAYASMERVKWRCAKGHEWFTTVAQRTSRKSGCPYCSGRIANSENNLKTWCLNNGSWGQQIIKEWTGLDENNEPISMDSLAKASSKKVTKPKAQPQQGINDLYTWCLNNGEWGQQLLQEWTGFDENNQFGMIVKLIRWYTSVNTKESNCSILTIAN